jgi:hypothetical protein
MLKVFRAFSKNEKNFFDIVRKYQKKKILKIFFLGEDELEMYAFGVRIKFDLFLKKQFVFSKKDQIFYPLKIKGKTFVVFNPYPDC